MQKKGLYMVNIPVILKHDILMLFFLPETFTMFALSAGFLLTKINIGKTGNQNPPDLKGDLNGELNSSKMK